MVFPKEVGEGEFRGYESARVPQNKKNGIIRKTAAEGGHLTFFSF